MAQNKEGEKVIIKELNVAHMKEEEAITTRSVLRELKSLDALEHPNIIKFKDVYQMRGGDRICIVMD